MIFDGVREDLAKAKRPRVDHVAALEAIALNLPVHAAVLHDARGRRGDDLVWVRLAHDLAHDAELGHIAAHLGRDRLELGPVHGALVKAGAVMHPDVNDTALRAPARHCHGINGQVGALGVATHAKGAAS